MIISRTAFNLHFGQAKPAIAIWKEVMDVAKTSPEAPHMRLLTDMSGPNYTLVTELHLRSFMDYGTTNHVWMSNQRIRELYPKFIPLCASSTTDLFHVEHQVGDPPSAGHIVESMRFKLRFGQAKPACAIWRKVMDMSKGNGFPMRLYTDITGDSYTMVVEMWYKSMMEYGPHQHAWMTNDQLREQYALFVPLCEGSRRTLYKVEHVV